MNRHVGPGHLPSKQLLPPPMQPVSTCPANSNEHNDTRNGQIEFWARCAIHDLLTARGLDEGRELIAEDIIDWIEGRR